MKPKYIMSGWLEVELSMTEFKKLKQIEKAALKAAELQGLPITEANKHVYVMPAIDSWIKTVINKNEHAKR